MRFEATGSRRDAASVIFILPAIGWSTWREGMKTHTVGTTTLGQCR